MGLVFLWLRSDIKALRSDVSEVVATLKDRARGSPGSRPCSKEVCKRRSDAGVPPPE